MFDPDDDPFYDLMARYDYYREGGFDTGDLDYEEPYEPVDAAELLAAPSVPAPVVEERQWEDDDIPF